MSSNQSFEDPKGQKDQLKIGRYEIRDELGEGGMGTVYLAYDPVLEREVAVKVLQPQLFVYDPNFALRFEHEAKTVASLEHSNIVSLYEFGQDGEWLYFVMPLMRGGTLSDRIAGGPLSLKETTSILERIGGALDKAHSRNIVHRDIKPGNILFDEDGDAFLSDFGIVKVENSNALSTRTDQVFGTPHYMSPEQIDGEVLDGRSDIYSLGVVLYEMLTGIKPYDHDSMPRLFVMHLNDPVPSIVAANPDLPAGLDEIIQKAMAKKAEDRYPNVAELLKALIAVANKPLDPQPIIPMRVWGSSVLIALFLIVLGVSIVRGIGVDAGDEGTATAVVQVTTSTSQISEDSASVVQTETPDLHGTATTKTQETAAAADVVETITTQETIAAVSEEAATTAAMHARKTAASATQAAAETKAAINLTATATFDSDKDGLPDVQEKDLCTDSARADSDDDGLDDGTEVNGKTNPCDADTDNDNLLDGEEINVYATDPLDYDTDYDGLNDSEEVNVYGTDPLTRDVGSTWLRPKDNMTMVYVPPGSFLMGSDDTQIDLAFATCEQLRGSDKCQRWWFGAESPQHKVILDGFWLDQTEITNTQYAIFLNENGNQQEGGATWLHLEDSDVLIEQQGNTFQPKYGFADHPVVEVSWYGAEAYCEWVGGQLPTEAQWEYAARSEDALVYPWGNTFDGNNLNFCDVNCTNDWKNKDYDDGFELSAPVGSYPDGRSWVSGMDMAGNVWEWVNDWYDNEYYANSPAENPPGPDSTDSKVLRGGSWLGSADNEVRAARRADFAPKNTGNVGFRCVQK